MTHTTPTPATWQARVQGVRDRWRSEIATAVNRVYAVSWHYGFHRVGSLRVQVVPAGALAPRMRWMSPKGEALILSVGRDRRGRAVVRTDRGAWSVGLGRPVSVLWR